MVVYTPIDDTDPLWANSPQDGRLPLTYTIGGEPPPDTTPPTRSSGSPSGTLTAGAASMVMSLGTTEDAICGWAEIPDMAYAEMTNTFATTGGMVHSQTVSGLTDGSCYNRYVRCIDGAGNANTDDYLISWSVAEEGEPNPTCSGCFPWELFMPVIESGSHRNKAIQQMENDYYQVGDL